MRSARQAGIATVIFVILVPGTVIGSVPYILTRWRCEPALGNVWLLQPAGVMLFVAGLPVLLTAMFRFVRDGRGTPAPVLPTESLVVTGLYRFVRNPMYVAVVAMVAGQGLFFGSPSVLIYAACLGVVFHLFVLFYEEPTLRARYGETYDDYCRAVGRWLPRSRPWERAKH